MNNDVGCRYKKLTGLYFGRIDTTILSGAVTNLTLPLDYPIIQYPSLKLLVAVINYYFGEVNIYYSECELIRDDLSYDCLTPFK